MPDHRTVTVEGTITHVFGHRFVLKTDKDFVLADLTPKGVDRIAIGIGDKVSLTGEMKPSELKVTQFTSGGKTIAIEHKMKHHEREHHAEADPRRALAVAEAAGFVTVGEPRRKPKHFEVLGRRQDQLTELHIELDGHIRKTKPVDRHDSKWIEALNGV